MGYIYDLKPIKGFGNNKFAYCPQDGTIRYRGIDNVLGLDHDFKISPITREKKKVLTESGFFQYLDEYVTFFAGMSEEEQGNILPIVANGLSALLLKAVRLGRKGWQIDNCDDICISYTKGKEDGLPFEKKELKEHFQEILNSWNNDKQHLQDLLPASLIECINTAICTYCNNKKNKVGRPIDRNLDWIIGDEQKKQVLLNSLKEEIGDRKGTEAAIVICAAYVTNLLTCIPDYSDIEGLFPNVNKSTYFRKRQFIWDRINNRKIDPDVFKKKKGLFICCLEKFRSM